MQCDYLVVGQGIAGSMLSYSLLKRNKKVIVLDEPLSSTSLAIQHAMYSPIIFKRFTKAWMVDKVLPIMVDTYKELEKILNISFISQCGILRVLASDQERKLWLSKSMEEGYWPYLDDAIIQQYSPVLEALYGYGLVKNAGTIDLYSLLTAYKDYLKEKNMLVEAAINYEEIKISHDKVYLNGITAKKLIFCEGYRGLNNPFFKSLPFVLAKGELLKAKIKGLTLNHIISSGIHISPVGHEEFILGSTYNWNDLNMTETLEARQELVDKARKFVKTDIDILEQYVGIRPTVKDRRPLIGLHPELPQVGIFNGMGTKGVSIAPYFAEHFADHLLNQADLMPEVYAFRHAKEGNKM